MPQGRASPDRVAAGAAKQERTRKQGLCGRSGRAAKQHPRIPIPAATGTQARGDRPGGWAGQDTIPERPGGGHALPISTGSAGQPEGRAFAGPAHGGGDQLHPEPSMRGSESMGGRWRSGGLPERSREISLLHTCFSPAHALLPVIGGGRQSLFLYRVEGIRLRNISCFPLQAGHDPPVIRLIIICFSPVISLLFTCYFLPSAMHKKLLKPNFPMLPER